MRHGSGRTAVAHPRALGLFSLLMYLVVQRRREAGIRMALGALAAIVLSMTALRDVFRGINGADPVSFVLAAGVLIATALAASAHPALRAAKTDPASVLRSE